MRCVWSCDDARGFLVAVDARRPAAVDWKVLRNLAECFGHNIYSRVPDKVVYGGGKVCTLKNYFRTQETREGWNFYREIPSAMAIQFVSNICQIPV